MIYIPEAIIPFGDRFPREIEKLEFGVQKHPFVGADALIGPQNIVSHFRNIPANS